MSRGFITGPFADAFRGHRMKLPSADSDLFLFQIPTNFPYVAEAALREFFRALQAGKDAEPSWKKAIYKVIARLDENVPEYFRLPSFLEQLE